MTETQPSYRNVECENCGRIRVELDGICEKCRWDNDGHDWVTITRPNYEGEG